MDPGSLPSLCCLGRASGGRTLDPAGWPLSPGPPCGALRTLDSGFCASDCGRATGRRPESGSWTLGAPGRLTSVTPDRGSWIWNHVHLPSAIRFGLWVLGHPPGLCWRPSPDSGGVVSGWVIEEVARTPDSGFWIGGSCDLDLIRIRCVEVQSRARSPLPPPSDLVLVSGL